ncbi:MAG: methyltransferase [Candidatus Bathyarchaeum sp.]|nr:MAG: methyltransferase [Candidatus Bathyarchaeum sp.]
MKRVLADKLEPEELKRIYKSYDIVGDVAIIRVPESQLRYSKLIAETIMTIHREVKSVWRQSSSVSGDFRLRNLEHILGKETTETCYREHGCVYKTDLQKAYFSPRLSYERMRIAGLIQKGETVVNMFAGVGCYSIAMAKHSAPLKVYSVDVNPSAFHYLRENIRINRVETVVVPLQGDAKEVIEVGLQNVADRVLMPLPELALEYLDYALLALKLAGGWLHYYSFEHAKRNEDPVQKAEKQLSEKLDKLCEGFRVNGGRIVRTIGPRWYQVVLDVHVGN